VRSIVFSDEHYVDTNDRSSRKQWVRCCSKLHPRTRLSRFNVPSVQIWAAVGYDYKSELVFVDWGNNDDGKVQRMTADLYKRYCLQPNVATFLRRKALFMQDGARCHTAKTVMTYLENKKVNVMQGWPAHSPDFNMIESIWSELDRELSKLVTKEVRSKDALKPLVQQAWANVPQRVINNHVMHFHTVMAEARRK
jgi:hypothetical protein